MESEMTRLDDARVNGADGDLVHLVAFDAEVMHDAWGRRRRRRRVGVPPVRRVKANGLQPRMSERDAPELLGDLALEEVRLRALGRHGLEHAAFHAGTSEEERRRRFVGDDHMEVERRPWRTVIAVSEERRDTTPFANALDHELAELLLRQHGNGLERDRLAVLDGRDGRVRHGAPPM
jgi:hypothetical protein